MGPPPSAWLWGAYQVSQRRRGQEARGRDRCRVVTVFDSSRLDCISLTVALVLCQVLISLTVVSAGPVLFSPFHLQGGAVTLARNIRHLPCISRRTAQEGVCMFAIDCLKANGSHLGTCIDRFYFGSCCQIPDKAAIPQIEDNSIDDTNFVHPQKDQFHTNAGAIQEPIFPTRKPTTTTTTTEKQVNVANETVVTESANVSPVESKTESAITTLESKVDDEDQKLTTLVSIETTTKSAITKTSTGTPKDTATSEVPLKLSTFQTVSGEFNSPTDKINKTTEIVTTEATILSSKTTTTPVPTTTTTTTTTTTIRPRPQTSRKPIRTTQKPTYRPRPTLKPLNVTRPQYGVNSTASKPLNVTLRPRPTKPVSAFNITRIPPYKPPPKRPPPTKKPIPIPPRLNITILPQSTSIKPITTERPLIATIAYINTTVLTWTAETPKPESTTLTTVSSTISSTVTSSTVSSTTLTSSTSSSPSSSSSEKVTTETITESDVLDTSPTVSSTEALTTEKSTTTSKKPAMETSELPSAGSSSTTETTESEPAIENTIADTVTEKATLQLNTTVGVPLTTEAVSAPVVTEFPPGLVTWSNTVDAATKAPQENVTSADETWSPITPPEGWVLISTIPPKPETPSTSQSTESTAPSLSTATITTTEEPSNTSAPTPTTTSDARPATESPLSTASIDTSSEPSSIAATSSSTTEDAIPEFTVNVTLSPTVPTSTSALGLSTFSSVSSENVTESIAAVNESLGDVNGSVGDVNGTTAAPNDTIVASTIASNVTEQSPTPPPGAESASSTSTVSPTTTESYNMTNYKDVCGRRLWPEARIVGGEKSAFGRWPWQISLRQWRTSTYLHKCGAALLNENWAITAAHCVEHVPPSELLVRLGEHDLANEDEPYGFAERRVQIVASHPHFDPATFEYDLALLRFYEPVTFQPNILPVCVPDTDEDFVGKTAYVTGWGRLYDEGPLPSVLQEVSVPVINNTACEAMYQAAGYNEHIPNIFICAGWRKGGSDSCEGDSGGPMVLQRERDKRFVLGGVISWGIGCAEPNQPGVYTRISEFRDWINQILQF